MTEAKVTSYTLTELKEDDGPATLVLDFKATVRVKGQVIEFVECSTYDSHNAGVISDDLGISIEEASEVVAAIDKAGNAVLDRIIKEGQW